MRTTPIDSAFADTNLHHGAQDPTYAGATSFMRRRYLRDLTGVDVAILGIPLDTATSNRPGARFGPRAVRQASAILDGDPQFPFQTDIFAEMAVVDYGDVALDLAHPYSITGAIESCARQILDAGVHVFAIGGDHYVTWPLLKVHAERYGPLSLVQFDAHQDTWTDDGKGLSHGTFVHRAVREGVIDPDRSIQVGIRTHAPQTCGIRIIDARTAHEMGPTEIANQIREHVSGHPAYLTFDIDCLDPAFAPGTGTPVSGGLSSLEALATLSALCDIEFIGGDIVEVSPPYDHAELTALAAAHVGQHYLGLLAANRVKKSASVKTSSG